MLDSPVPLRETSPEADAPGAFQPSSPVAVCGIAELEGHDARGVTHVLSILDPEWPALRAFERYGRHERTTLRFHDAIVPEPGIVMPGETDIEAILAFGRTLAGGTANLLVHCHLGISRSTAALAMVLAQAYPDASELRLLEHVLAIRPQAWPNSVMIALADSALGRDGRLTEATRRLYGWQLARRPQFAELMRGVNRGAEVDMAIRE